MTTPDPGEQRTVVLDAPLPPAAAPPAPVEVPAAPAAQRIEALDFVRGIALFGILLMNIIGMGLPDAYTNPNNAGGATGANLTTWIITQIGFEGTQRALFSMLFGASVILLTSRLEASGRPDAADIYFRRNLWLVALGFVNAFVFLWYGDILYAYGICALFVFAFRKLAPKWLLIFGVFTLFLGTVWTGYETYDLIRKHDDYQAAIVVRDAGTELSQQQQTAISDWEGARTTFKASPERIESTTKAMRGGWWSAFKHIARINGFWQSWGAYRYFFDIFGMMLIGMGLYRFGVLTLERRTGLYVAMMLGGYAIGLAVNIIETRWILSHNFSAIAFAEANVSYDLGRLTMTVGHLGTLLLFVRSGAFGLLRRAVAAVGQMAVTNYLMQSVITSFLFIGLAWYNQLERHQLYYVVFSIWAFQLVLSPIWLRYFRFGPVEWLWRYLTYLKRPPFRRVAGRVDGGVAGAVPAAA
jgi:uncharacterized protein